MTDRILRVVLQPVNFRSGAGQIRSSLNGIGRDARAAGQTGSHNIAAIGTQVNRAGRQARQASTQFGDLANAVRAVVAATAVRQVVRLVDEYTNVRNTLRVIVRDAADLSALQQDILRQANETGTEYASQASLVARIARANAAIGASGQEVLTVSRAVAQSFALAGAGADEAAAATRQLGQALASGRLAGDELRSILENSPVLAESIARGFDTTIGGLRRLGGEGALSSQRVFQAILADAEKINDEFASFEPTISRGAVAIGNSLQGALAELDSGLGASEGIASSLLDAAEIIETDLIPNIAVFGDTLRGTTALIFADIARIVAQIDVQLNRVSNTIADFRDGDSFASELLDGLIDKGGEAADTLRGLVEQLPGQGGPFTAPFRLLLDGVTALDESTDSAAESQAALADALRQAGVAEETRNTILEQAIARRAELEEEAQRRRAGLRDDAALGPDAEDSGAQAASEAAAKAQSETQKLIDSLQEQAVELEINRRAGDNASAALRAYTIAQVAAAGATEEQITALRRANEALNAQEELDRQAQAFADLKERAEGLARAVELPAEALRRTINEINELASATDAAGQPLIDTETRVRAIRDATDEYVRSLDDAEPAFDAFAEFATQAARSTQQAFADFLFDPFQDGLDGLLSSFLDTLRQIAANQLANSILNSLGSAAGGSGNPILGALGSLITPRSNGGSVQGGRPFLVGEDSAGRGGELFVPPAGGGRIIPERAAPQAAAPAQDGGGTVVIVEQDPQAVVSALGTAAGRDQIIRAISADPDTYRAILGVPT